MNEMNRFLPTAIGLRYRPIRCAKTGRYRRSKSPVTAGITSVNIEINILHQGNFNILKSTYFRPKSQTQNGNVPNANIVDKNVIDTERSTSPASNAV